MCLSQKETESLREFYFHAFCYIVSWNETKHNVIVIQTLELWRSPFKSEHQKYVFSFME